MLEGEKLTGNIRYRVCHRTFRRPLVVLQVEITWKNGPCDSYGMYEYLAGSGWRDATPEDLQYINNKEK